MATPVLDTIPNSDRGPDLDEDNSSPIWGWIAGAVVLVMMLVFLFGGSSAPIEESVQVPKITTIDCPVKIIDEKLTLECPAGTKLKSIAVTVEK